MIRKFVEFVTYESLPEADQPPRVVQHQPGLSEVLVVCLELLSKYFFKTCFEIGDQLVQFAVLFDFFEKLFAAALENEVFQQVRAVLKLVF